MHTDAAEIDIRSQDKSTATQMEMAQTAATTAQKMRTEVSTIITPTEQSQLDQLAQALSAIQAHLQTAENAVSEITRAREKVTETSATLAALKGEITGIEVPDVEKQQEEKIILGDKIVTQNTLLSNLDASLKDLLDVTGNRSDMRQSSQDESWELATEPLNNAVEETMANASALRNEIDTTSELTQQKITETQEQSEHIGMHFGSAEKSLQLIQTAVKEVTQQLDDARKNFEQTKNNSVEEQA
jgi:prefoldin subunit 5